MLIETICKSIWRVDEKKNEIDFLERFFVRSVADEPVDQAISLSEYTRRTFIVLDDASSRFVRTIISL